MSTDLFKTAGTSPPQNSHVTNHAGPAVSSGSSPGPEPTSKPDFLVRSEGTIWLFTPQTPAAFDFLENHISPESTYWGLALVVEHRYVKGLLCGLIEHDLKAVRE